MSDEKYADDDPERTLVTLDQLSQTIEVMTSVVNRLRRHLSDQIKAQLEAQQELSALAAAQAEEAAAERENDGEPIVVESLNQEDARESFVVEISQQEVEPSTGKPTKTLH